MIRTLLFLSLVLTSVVFAQTDPKPVTTDSSKVIAPNISVLATPGWNAAQAGKFEEAAALYEKTGQAGDNDSRWLLAGLHFGKKLKNSSPERGKLLLEQAAAEGHPAANYDLGVMIQMGSFDGKPDSEKAHFHYQQAAESGHARSQYLMGLLAIEPGPKRNEKAALEWFNKAAAQNLADAKYALVQFHDKGLAGVSVDPKQGTALCLQAAIAGSALAMNEMGIRYQRETGIARDEVAAIGWFSLAGQFNLAAAHINLGNCYETARGCKQDINLAGSHYAAASKLNHPVGQFLLAQFFEEGKGTEKNPVHAYVLYSHAAAQNHEEATKRRDALEKKLSKEQIEEAKKLLKGNFTP